MSTAKMQACLGCLSQVGLTRVVIGAAVVLLAVMASRSDAQVTYSVNSAGVYGGFNNSKGSETEDDFVANSFTVLAGGTHLTDVV